MIDNASIDQSIVVVSEWVERFTANLTVIREPIPGKANTVKRG